MWLGFDAHYRENPAGIDRQAYFVEIESPDTISLKGKPFTVPSVQSPRHRIRWDVNPADGTLVAWLDGVRRAAFKDQEGLKGRQDMVFENLGGQFAITQLRLQKGGVVRSLAEAPAADTLWLTNGDIVSGTLRGIADGKAVFASDLARMEIPLARLRRIEFSSGHGRMPPSDPAAGRVFFDDLWSLAVRIEAVEGGVVRGVSPVLGKCAFPVEGVSRIQFRPSPKKDAKAPPEGAGGGQVEKR